MKILKYPCGWDGNRKAWWAMMPEGRVIRTEFVDDGTYKGYWVWAIVNENDRPKLTTFQWLDKVDIKPDSFVQLGILEKQTVHAPVAPFERDIIVKDGRIFLVSEIVDDKLEEIEVLGYKTGQNVDDKINFYHYVGFAPLKIKDEIAIYFFIKRIRNDH